MGQMSCWGDNTFGQSTPPGGIFASVSVGGELSCGARLDGTVSCWGSEEAAPQIVVMPQALPDGFTGAPYARTITASGGTPPYTFSVVDGSLPPGLALAEDGQISGTPTTPGAYAFTVQAADSSNPAFNGQRAYQINILEQPADTTPPEIRVRVTGDKGKDGWYISPVKVEWSVTDPESEILSTSGCETVTLKEDTRGEVLTCTAASEGGEASRSVKIKIDQTDPTLKPRVHPIVILLHGSAKVDPNADDATSGLKSVNCGEIDSSSVGIKEVVCTAVDNAGHRVTKTAKYAVIYKFKGFYPPVKNFPAINPADAGETIIFKWKLYDANGEPVNSVDKLRVKVKEFTCPAGLNDVLPDDAALLEGPVLPEGSALPDGAITAGDASDGDNTYVYKWETSKEMAGTCQKVIIELGEEIPLLHIALFDFR
jgi:hypothetical protein